MTLNNKSSNETKYVAECLMGEGLCHQFVAYVELRLLNGELTGDVLFTCGCDEKVERALRQAIDDEHSGNNDYTYIEDLYYEAHTLKYQVNGHIVSEDEYTAAMEVFWDNYDVLVAVSGEEFTFVPARSTR